MRKMILLYCICLIAVTANWAWSDDGQWQKISNPYVIGQIDEIAIGHYNNTRYIFAADSSAEGTLFRTTYDGASWEKVHDEPGFWHPRVVVKETDSRYGFTLMRGDTDPNNHSGPYRTENGGADWQLKANGLTTRKLEALAAVQNSQDLMVAFVGGEGNAFNEYEKLFKTTNGGDNWVLSQSGLPDEEYGEIFDICIDQDEPDRLFCSFRGVSNNSTRGLYQSTDGGSNWNQVIEFDAENINAVPSAIAYDSNADRLFVVEKQPDEGSIFQIDDPFGDYSVSYLGNYGPSKCIRVDNSGNAYFAFQNNEQSVQNWVARYNGENWDFLSSGNFIGDLDAYSVEIDPVDDNTVCVGGRFMFYYSDDQGETFEERVYGATPVGVVALGTNGNDICAASRYDVMIFKNADYTDSESRWSLRLIHGDGAPMGLEKDWNDQYDSWFLGTRDRGDEYAVGWIYRSTDDGDSWNLMNAEQPIPLECLTPDLHSDYLYVGSTADEPEEGLFWASEDNGQSWDNCQIDQNTNVRSIAVRPDQSSYVLAAEYGSGIYRSNNYGGENSWTLINSGLTNLNGLKVKYCPVNSNIALLGTEAGVFKSRNVNAETPTWQATEGSMAGQVQDIEFHATDNANVCLSMVDEDEGRIYISADTGRSWITMSTGLFGNHVIYDLAVDINHPDTFYAATDDGVYKLKNPVKRGTLPSTPSVQTWGPGVIIVNGDITIPQGVTLNISAGTTVKMIYDFDICQGGAHNSKSEIIVYGALNANGTQNAPVVFASSHETNPQPNHWYGIRSMAGSAINLNYCQVKHAYGGLFAGSPASLSVVNCLFEDNYMAGLYLDGTYNNAEITGTTIQDCGTYGIYGKLGYLYAGQDVIIGNRYGIYYLGDAAVTIEECQVSATGVSSYYGIYAEGYEEDRPEIHITQCDISNFQQGGIYLDGLYEGSDIADITESDAGMYGIYLSDCSAGLGVVSGEANRIASSTYGLWADKDGAISVRRTKFENNGVENVHIAEGGWAEMGTEEDYGENSFFFPEEAQYYVYNENEDYIYAQYNFWELVDEEYFYNVIYDPWLEEDPLPRREGPIGPAVLAADFELAEAFPNPFNPTATIRFSLASPKEVNVDIYNLLGQKVRRLYSGQAAGGTTSLIWDGENDIGQKVAASLYLVQLRTAESRRAIKVTVLK